MTLKNTLYAVLGVSTIGLSVMAPAQAIDIDGNLAATSTYMWRGIAQSPGAAIQGGADFAMPIGANKLHFSGWTSNVFGGTEFDILAGFSGSFSGLEYDAGVTLYRYPQAASNASFEELYAGVSQGSLSAKFSTSSDMGEYIEIAADFPVATWKMTAHFGHYSRDGQADYADYAVSFSKPMVKGYDLSFMVSDTDLSGDDYRTTITLSSGFKI